MLFIYVVFFFVMLYERLAEFINKPWNHQSSLCIEKANRANGITFLVCQKRKLHKLENLLDANKVGGGSKAV